MRLDKNDYLWRLAFQVAERSTCPRFHAGCVVARDGIILSTGYNGSVEGEPHCDDVGCQLVHIFSADADDTDEKHCVHTVHAEINCIVNAARSGISIDRCDWYINGISCWACSKAIARLDPLRIYMVSGRGVSNQDEEHLINWWSGRTHIIIRTEEPLKKLGVIGKEQQDE